MKTITWNRIPDRSTTMGEWYETLFQKILENLDKFDVSNPEHQMEITVNYNSIMKTILEHTYALDLLHSKRLVFVEDSQLGLNELIASDKTNGQVVRVNRL